MAGPWQSSGRPGLHSCSSLEPSGSGFLKIAVRITLLSRHLRAFAVAGHATKKRAQARTINDFEAPSNAFRYLLIDSV